MRGGPNVQGSEATERVAIVAVPTMVWRVHGMSVGHMPEPHWRYGRGMVVGVIPGYVPAAVPGAPAQRPAATSARPAGHGRRGQPEADRA